MSVRILIGDVRERKRPGPPKGYRFSPEVLARRKRTSLPLKAVLLCRSCGHSWERVETKIKQDCSVCGSSVDARHRPGAPRDIAKLKEWRDANPALARASGKAGRHLMRRAALMAVGRGEMRCVRCGCDRYEALEINHKNGGGHGELSRLKGKFYRDIARRIRAIDDLEICCRVCNALDHLERTLGPLPFTVTWGGK